MRNIFTVPDDKVFQGHARDNFELLKAWAGTTLAYAIYPFRGDIVNDMFIQTLLVASVVCGLGFVLHELAHRMVARRFGAQAHFVANNGALIVSILVAFAGVFIAAPGAVWYRGAITKQQNGQIALAGPVANFILAVLFFVPLAVMVVNQARGLGSAPGWLQSLCYVGFSLNAWLGLFNMIPAGPFDGAKVLEWSPVVFGVTVVIGVALAFGLTNEAVLGFLLQAVLAILGSPS